MKHYVLTTVLLVAALVSCKKDATVTSNASTTATTTSPSPTGGHRKAEQAFPDLHGDIIGIKSGPDSIYVEKKGDGYVWMGDIVLDQQHFDALQKPAGVTTNRTFTEDYTKLWPSGQVFYTIAAGFSQAEQQFIADAMAEWQNNTPIRFTQRTNQANYVLIRPGSAGSGLYSSGIGMLGGQQIINLESGMFGAGEIEHEIGHTIGFYHEQCRTDRSIWINVYYNYVYPNSQSNIYQYQTYDEVGLSGWQLDAFDFGSIMLYSSTDLWDGNPAHYPMTDINGQPFFAQRGALSAGDIATAFYMYHPIYVRVTSTTNDSYDDAATVSGDGTVTAQFYTDAAGTIPATLTEPLLLNYSTATTSDCSGSESIQSSNMIIPVGNPGTVTIGSFSYYYTYDAAEDPISCSSSYTSVAPGVGYWQIQ